MPRHPGRSPSLEPEDWPTIQAQVRQRAAGSCESCARPIGTPVISAADRCWYDRVLGWRDRRGRTAREQPTVHVHGHPGEEVQGEAASLIVVPVFGYTLLTARGLCEGCAEAAGWDAGALA